MVMIDSSASTKKLAKSQSLKGSAGDSVKERAEQASGGKSCRWFISHQSAHPSMPVRLVIRALSSQREGRTGLGFHIGGQSLPLYMLGVIEGHPGQSQSFSYLLVTSPGAGEENMSL